ncbi:MAG TPA: FHA domain-containing protein, partial [Lacipirellula sp.]
MATLTILQGNDTGKQFTLAEGESVIGRSHECDIVLDVAAVSRRHAIVSADNGLFFVKDNGSRNGTFVNGRQVIDQHQLRDGDQILICDVLIEFHQVPQVKLPSIDPFAGSSLLAPLATAAAAADDEHSSIMATLDVSKDGRASWQVSARPEQQLQAMIEISTNLSNTLSVKDILPKILDSLFKIFVQADRGFIIMRPKPGGPLAAIVTKARRGDDDDMRWSRTIVERAMEEKKAILSADAASDARFNMAQSIADFHIRSLICAPMIDSSGEPMGVIQIDTSDQRSRFTDLDLQVLAGVAGQAA